ncbi:hypothetical protein HAX54_019589 [Datura stramonium]|uniref:Uncharacterized protein n=1 Tax=Datura stramonium TaxID=4076 RepID=A0ABS8URV8_DATST|nr:hypothetical protein [Datura stramonium]
MSDLILEHGQKSSLACRRSDVVLWSSEPSIGAATQNDERDVTPIHKGGYNQGTQGQITTKLSQHNQMMDQLQQMMMTISNDMNSVTQALPNATAVQGTLDNG